jgi:hypothetical protein
MPRSILAVVTPDNTPGGSLLTLIIPLGLGVIVAVVLYLRFSRPHRRVPDRPVLVVTQPAVPDPEVAAAAAVAAGLPTAAGGGGAESVHEPAGVARESAAQAEPSNVSARDPGPAEVPEPAGGATAQDPSAQDPSAADGTEAGE